MERIVILLALLTLVGCKSLKDKSERQEAREVTESVKKTTTRIGDTVTYVVPNITFKDTTITRTNRVTGTTQVLRYDSEGRLSAAECISGFIQIVEEQNRSLIEAFNEAQKKKESEIPASTILYALVGMGLFFAILMIVGFLLLRKYLKTLLPLP